MAAKILVTGATGTIGKALISKLLETDTHLKRQLEIRKRLLKKWVSR